ncbi:MAG TPA: autotransporter assembly complex family protein [Thermoanaerobaculia bacterium]|nr:autotransporter assembly complex family protein [Thermoanaerobaculia bacterium]
MIGRRLPGRRREGARAPRLAAASILAMIAGMAAAGARPAHAAESLRVEIDGLSGELRKNALANLAIEKARKDKDLDESRIRRLHGQAPDEIQQALQPFGYYRVVVDASLSHDGATWVAHYKVDEGPQLKVTTRDIQLLGEGSSDAGFQQVVHAFPLHEGEALSQVAYEVGKKAFDDYASDHGYLDGKFLVSQIQIDLATYTSSIVLHYQSGPLYRFGPVRFHQHFLRPSLLQGYIRFKQGDPLAAPQLLLLQESLADSTYFQRVEVVPRRDEAAGVEVPIDVNLVPAKPQKWTAGLGYGTDTGPRGTLGLELRHLNELGHRFTSEGKVSLVEKSIRMDYLVPGFYPRSDVLDFTVAYADLRPKTSHSENLLIGPSYSFGIGRWRQAVALDYQRETYTVGVDKGISALVIPQDTWTRVYADDRIYPSHGEKYTFIARGGAKALASDVNFAQLVADAKFVQSLDHRRRFRLISRVTGGYTATDDFRHLPPTERFFAGGDQSVRGYAYQGIGARDERGNVIGGPDTLVASAEVEYRLEQWQRLQKFGLAAFYDAGTAGFSFGGGMQQGTGLGVFWISPIGLVRVYVATALSLPGHPLRLHLTIGPDL